MTNKPMRPNPFSNVVADSFRGVDRALVQPPDPFGNDKLSALEEQRDTFKRQYEQERSDNQKLRELVSGGERGRAALQNAQETIRKQNEFIEGIQEKPQVVVTVQKRINAKTGLITFQGNAMRVNLPDGAEAGDQVMVLTDTGQPTDKADEPLAFGVIVTIDRIEKDRCFFEGSGGGQASAYMKKGLTVETGDRVQLDPSGTVALMNLGRDKTKFSVEQCPDVKWTDIGGHEEAKEAFREALEYPTTYASVYKAYGAPVSKGVLLYGPPGTGKTMLAKAAANSVSKDGRGGFIYVKGPELLSKWVGESETTVRSLFGRARAHKAETGNMAVIFIDEADALLGVREGVGTNVLTSTLVPSFLAEMDGIEDSAAFVVLATNRPDSLDPAVVRDGRIDRRIRIGRPDKKGTLDILKLHLRGKLLQPFEPEAVVEEIWDDKHALYMMEFDKNHVTVGLGDMLSGAVLAGFVGRASRLAIRRDRTAPKPLGISLDDMLTAVRDSYVELAAVNPNDLFLEKVDLYGPPSSIKKVQFHAGTKTKEMGRAVNWRSGFQASSERS